MDLKENGRHCETAVVDDEPTAGVAGSATEELCARAPVGLLAELTHRCPLQCAYCSNPLELERVNKELSTETWVSVMSQAGAMGILQVHLSGGEPTARKDLEEIVAAASKAGLYSNLITAAVLLNRQRLEGLAKRGLDHVQISFQDIDAENAERIGAYPGATEEEARGRPLGDRARPAAHRQRADPPPEHPQCRPLYRACHQARRPAARDRPCAILRLGLSQPRRPDPDLRPDASSRSSSSSASASG